MIDTAEGLLAELDAAGVVLSIVEDGLAFDGPEDLLTDDLLGMMRMHRDDLLTLVEHREEGLAIVEADGLEADPSTSIVCPWCRSERLADDDDGGGVRCESCGRLAWLAVDGSLVRADAEDVDVVGVHPDDVDACPACGDLCDTMTAMGGWSCSRCEPGRTATTARWLVKRERILARRG